MQRFVVLFLAITLMMGAVDMARASMRCGNLLVREGTDSLEIQAACGDPAVKDKFYLDKYGEVDKWAYGPEGGVMYVIYIFAGKVVKIEQIRQ